MHGHNDLVMITHWEISKAILDGAQYIHFVQVTMGLKVLLVYFLIYSFFFSHNSFYTMAH